MNGERKKERKKESKQASKKERKKERKERRKERKKASKQERKKERQEDRKDRKKEKKRYTATNAEIPQRWRASLELLRCTNCPPVLNLGMSKLFCALQIQWLPTKVNHVLRNLGGGLVF